jgi:uncharacterized protein YcnI
LIGSRPLSRVATVVTLALGAVGIAAAQAQAHAVVSPPVAKSGVLQQFTLSVPTEEEGASTTKIELDVPSGFAVDSFEAAPGWKRQVVAQGSGEEAVVQKIVWTGGHVPTEEDSVFHINGSATKNQTYKFRVLQTYSNGKVVDWSGPESSDNPSPVVEAKSALGGGGSSNTLGVIALIVAALALVLALVGLAGGRRSLT